MVSKGIMRRLVVLSRHLRVTGETATEYGYAERVAGLVEALGAAMDGRWDGDWAARKNRLSMGVRDAEVDSPTGDTESISVEYNASFPSQPGWEFMINRTCARGRIGTPFPAQAIPVQLLDSLIFFCFSHAAFAAINAEMRRVGEGYTHWRVCGSEKPSYHLSEARQLVDRLEVLLDVQARKG